MTGRPFRKSKHSSGTKGKSKVAGRLLGNPAVERRRESHGKPKPSKDDQATKPEQKEFSHFRSFLAEVNGKLNTTSTTSIAPSATKVTAAKPTPVAKPEEYNPSAPQLTKPDEYNSSAPQLTLPDECYPLIPQRAASDPIVRPENEQRVNAKPDPVKPYVHNPFYLDHIFSSALYTARDCKRCTPRRKCPRHRPVLQQQTSISLCRAGHVRMNLYWAVDDPVNTKSTWHFEIKEYFSGQGNGGNRRGCGGEDRESAAHEKCTVYEMNERWGELAARVVEDMKREKRVRLRSNVGRVRTEIAALAAAWERARRGGVREGERKERVEWKRALKKEMTKATKAAKEAKKPSEEREVDAAQPAGQESKHAVPAATKVHSTEGEVQQVASPPESTTASQKRKRSSNSESPLRVETPPKKKAKKVSWVPDLVDVERPRMASPKLNGEGEPYSPADEAVKEELIAA